MTFFDWLIDWYFYFEHVNIILKRYEKKIMVIKSDEQQNITPYFPVKKFIYM